MYYIKTFIFQQIAKSKLITLLLHKLWVFYQYLRSNFLYFKFFKINLSVNSLSDRGQDKWVIKIFNLKKKKYKGFFLEIGGGNGFANSNTFILEKNYYWSGIIVEPDPEQFKKLKFHRPKMILSNSLVYNKVKEIKFFKNGELSKIINTRKNLDDRKISKLKTITLKQLLKNNKAPKIIDFFSLDVEGSEDKVLTKEVLSKYIFLSLTIERPSYKLHKLLVKKNYVFIKSSLYDYFYINKKHKFFNDIIKNKKKLTGFYKNK
jgi:FkbM family methyltransferase